MTTNVEFSPATRFLLVAGAFVLVIADLHAAASLITPFLLAGLIAVIAARVSGFLNAFTAQLPEHQVRL